MADTASTSSGGVDYAHFRSHAAFVPTLADFALTERQFGRLLAEYGMDASAGLGLGDTRILYGQLSKSGFLTYDGLEQVYKILSTRRRRLHERVEEERRAAERKEAERRDAERAFRDEQAEGAASHVTEGHDSGQGHGAESYSQHRGLPPRLSVPPAPRQPHQQSAATPGPSGRVGGGNSTAYTRFVELLRPPPGVTEAPRSPGLYRPDSPSPVPRPSTSTPASWAATRSPTAPWLVADGDAGGGASPPGMGGTETIMVARTPPALLRETFPPPACRFPHIRSKLRGVREMMTGPDVRFCINALKELYKEWEAAAEEQKAKDELKRSKKKALDDATAISPSAAASAAAPAPALPLEGATFLLLSAAACCVTLKDYVTARRVLAAAESQFNTALFGVDHPYYFCIFLLQGIVHYYDSKFEEAIEKFEAARDLADMAARSKTDPTARKNAGCCLNNIGAACQMLGRRSEAVASYREAVRALQSACGLDASASEGAMRNLAAAVKSTFAMEPPRPRSAGLLSSAAQSASGAGALRPTQRPASALSASTSALRASVGAFHAPGASVGVAGLPVTASACNGKLQAFLRQAVTAPPPAAVAALPLWASRSNGEEAMKKAAAKAKGKGKEAKKDPKKDGKKAAKKDKGFKISYAMPYYDQATYGVANVSLAVKKKKKKAAAKKA